MRSASSNTTTMPGTPLQEERRARANERALAKARRAKRKSDTRRERAAIADAMRAVPSNGCRCQLRAGMTRADLAALGGGCTSPAYICPRLDAVRRRVGQ